MKLKKIRWEHDDERGWWRAYIEDWSLGSVYDAADFFGFTTPLGYFPIKQYKTLEFTPFDPVSKRTIATIEEGVINYQLAKGAPQAIMSLVDNQTVIAPLV